MIRIVQERTNRIMIKLESKEDVTGFTLELVAFGQSKSATIGAEMQIPFTFESSEILGSIGDKKLGSLVLSDTIGQIRKKVRLELKIVTPLSSDGTIVNTEFIFLVPSESTYVDSGGGGDSPDLSAYATKKDLSTAVNVCKQYTDNEVDGIITETVTEFPIPIKTPEGSPTTITVQESAQQVSNMNGQIKTMMDSYLVGSVVDEDGDYQPDDETLYFDKLQRRRLRRKLTDK